MGRYGEISTASLATVKIKRGETLRLRLISGASTYQFRFQIDGHPLTVIASDGLAAEASRSRFISAKSRRALRCFAQRHRRQIDLDSRRHSDGSKTKAVSLYTDGKT